LSESAEKICNEIINNLSKPVQFNKISKNHIEDDNGYLYEDESQYYIRLNSKLKQDTFESVAIHELLHCLQREGGGPGMTAREGDEAAGSIASLINSVIYDIDVERRLFELNMHSNEIDNNRFNDCLEALEFYNFDKLRELYIVSSAMFLILIKRTTANHNHFENLYSMYKGIDDRIVDLADQIDNILEKYGFSTPQEQCRSMRRIAIASGWRNRLAINFNGTIQEI
jgi:hypothetical protein